MIEKVWVFRVISPGGDTYYGMKIGSFESQLSGNEKVSVLATWLIKKWKESEVLFISFQPPFDYEISPVLGFLHYHPLADKERQEFMNTLLKKKS